MRHADDDVRLAAQVKQQSAPHREAGTIKRDTQRCAERRDVDCELAIHMHADVTAVRVLHIGSVFDLYEGDQLRRTLELQGPP